MPLKRCFRVCEATGSTSEVRQSRYWYSGRLQKTLTAAGHLVQLPEAPKKTCKAWVGPGPSEMHMTAWNGRRRNAKSGQGLRTAHIIIISNYIIYIYIYIHMYCWASHTGDAPRAEGFAELWE